MSWPTYPDVKASGIEWLGEVPSHWVVDRIKWSVASSQNGIWGAEPDGGPDDIRCVRVADFDRPRLAIQDRDVTYRNVSGPERRGRVLRRGDLIIEKSGGGENNPVGFVVLYDRTDAAVTSNFVARVTLRPGMEPRFWTYLHSWLYNSRLTRRSLKQTSGIQNLDQQSYFDERVCFPPPPDQVAIADFLDRETAKIDALIAKQEQLIATLREDRTATITHAVTKGIDPDVALKDSGVEWLGAVPQHWDVRQLKWGSPVKRGASPRPIDDPIYFDDEGLWSWVRIADVSASGGQLHKTTQRLSELGSSLSVKLKPGSLFVSIAGTVGKPCITQIPACIHDGFVYFPTLDLLPAYLYRIFEAGECYRGLGKLGTQLNLNTDTIGSIRMPVPPLSEQELIIDELDARCGKLDALIEKADAVINTLREYRSALITDAVTGKIDVRGAA